ncbi:MAG: SGNH/GDSL hydrolase family protein [Acidobacteriota bacterium]|nr:SGNH/GDSL hydrolase family protein [Acidobacteriota bacterium]MDQ3419870.1 SGNH/GDSL hydrolase family protein [Acidobacteriota bacterium]
MISSLTGTLMALLAISPLVQARAPLKMGDTGAPLVYAVLGDSTAAGVGAPYDDGIAVRTTAHLSLTRQVTMHNFAVSGARMRDVLEKQLPAAEAARPDLVLLSVAANDVTHLTSIPSMRSRLRQIVGRLRAANPTVQIVVTGSPDMGSPPRIPWILRGASSMRTKMVNGMFKGEAKRLDLVFAPIAEETGPAFRRDRTLFDDDRFHPNARGYAVWTAVLNKSLAQALSSDREGVLPRLLPPQN